MKTATVIKCIDYRQNGFFKKWLEENGIENSDIISVAGSIKELVHGTAERAEWLLSMVKISYDLHHSREIIITCHSDCGAYGIKDPEEEKRTQTEDLKKARDIIRQRFPDAGVKAYWLQLIGGHEKAENIIFNLID
jgi:carbonic anhydrase